MPRRRMNNSRAPRKAWKLRNRSRILRARSIVAYLKRAYPHPTSELAYRTPFQFLVAVILSAQCTDKAVNAATKKFFTKYRTAKDFSHIRESALRKNLSSLSFFRNKTKAIIGAAKGVVSKHAGRVPESAPDLILLPGIGYKTAHVILGELYGIWGGIPTDTHVRRFAKRFDLSDENDLTKISKDLESLIPKKDWKYVNNGLVLYGRYVCPARPHECGEHPLTTLYPKAASHWPKSR